MSITKDSKSYVNKNFGTKKKLLKKEIQSLF